MEGRLQRAGLSSALAAVSTAAAIFVIFRVSYRVGGPGIVGAWALLQGLFVIARIADSGAGTNLTRRFSLARSRDAYCSPWPLLGAGIALGTLPVVVLSGVAYYPIISYMSGRYTSHLEQGHVETLGALCVAFGVVMSLATLSMAMCDGAQKIVQRNVALILGNLCGASSVYPLWTRVGYPAIGLSYLITAAVPLVASLTILSRLDIASSPTMQFRSLLRDMWTENTKLNVLALTRLTFEPTTKLLLSFVAPLATLAAVDLAMKVTSQIRTLLQAALQPLLVYGAHEPGEITAELRNRFNRVSFATADLCAGALVLSLLSIPIISWLAFGSASARIFASSFGLLAIANSVNALGLSGYVFELSRGGFGALVRVQVVMACLNLAIGVSGWAMHSWGMVVAGYGLAFAYGGTRSLRFWTLAAGQSRRPYLARLCALDVLLSVVGALGLIYIFESERVDLPIDSIIYVGVLALSGYALHRRLRSYQTTALAKVNGGHTE